MSKELWTVYLWMAVICGLHFAGLFPCHQPDLCDKLSASQSTVLEESGYPWVQCLLFPCEEYRVNHMSIHKWQSFSFRVLKHAFTQRCSYIYICIYVFVHCYYTCLKLQPCRAHKFWVLCHKVLQKKYLSVYSAHNIIFMSFIYVGLGSIWMDIYMYYAYFIKFVHTSTSTVYDITYYSCSTSWNGIDVTSPH